MNWFTRFAQNMHVEPFRTMWLLLMGFMAGFIFTLIVI